MNISRYILIFAVSVVLGGLAHGTTAKNRACQFDALTKNSVQRLEKALFGETSKEKLKPLGHGGEGDIFWDPSKNTAYKFSNREGTAQGNPLARLQAEARLSQLLSPDGTGPFVRAVHLPDYQVLEMPYLGTMTLSNGITKPRWGDDPDAKKIKTLMQKPEVKQDVLRQLYDAVELAHSRGVILRDLKPNNIMLVPSLDAAGNVTGVELKIIDLGIASEVGNLPADVKSERSVLGTPTYMSARNLKGGVSEPAHDLDMALRATARQIVEGPMNRNSAYVKKEAVPGRQGMYSRYKYAPTPESTGLSFPETLALWHIPKSMTEQKEVHALAVEHKDHPRRFLNEYSRHLDTMDRPALENVVFTNWELVKRLDKVPLSAAVWAHLEQKAARSERELRRGYTNMDTPSDATLSMFRAISEKRKRTIGQANLKLKEAVDLYRQGDASKATQLANTAIKDLNAYDAAILVSRSPTLSGLFSKGELADDFTAREMQSAARRAHALQTITAEELQAMDSRSALYEDSGSEASNSGLLGWIREKMSP